MMIHMGDSEHLKKYWILGFEGSLFHGPDEVASTVQSGAAVMRCGGDVCNMVTKFSFPYSKSRLKELENDGHIHLFNRSVGVKLDPSVNAWIVSMTRACAYSFGIHKQRKPNDAIMKFSSSGRINFLFDGYESAKKCVKFDYDDYIFHGSRQLSLPNKMSYLTYYARNALAVNPNNPVACAIMTVKSYFDNSRPIYSQLVSESDMPIYDRVLDDLMGQYVELIHEV